MRTLTRLTLLTLALALAAAGLPATPLGAQTAPDPAMSDAGFLAPDELAPDPWTHYPHTNSPAPYDTSGSGHPSTAPLICVNPTSSGRPETIGMYWNGGRKNQSAGVDADGYDHFYGTWGYGAFSMLGGNEAHSGAGYDATTGYNPRFRHFRVFIPAGATLEVTFNAGIRSQSITQWAAWKVGNGAPADLEPVLSGVPNKRRQYWGHSGDPYTARTQSTSWTNNTGEDQYYMLRGMLIGPGTSNGHITAELDLVDAPAGYVEPGGCSDQAPTPDPPSGARVAIVGDSFIAGEGAVELEPDTGLPDQGGYIEGTSNMGLEGLNQFSGCHRSEHSWAYRAARETVGADPSDIEFIACSGATTAEFWGPNDEQHGNADPQLDQLEAAHDEDPVDVVFVSIGGNDAEFADLVTACLALPEFCNDDGVFDRTISFEIDAVTMEGENYWIQKAEAAAISVRSTLEELKVRAAGASVFLMLYPNPAAPGPDGTYLMCPGTGFLEFDDGPDFRGVTDTEQAWLNTEFLAYLNTLLADAADAAGVHVIDPSGSFSGHSVCADEPYAHGVTVGVSPDEYEIAGQLQFNDTSYERRMSVRPPALYNESIHPNIAGHAKLLEVANAVLADAGWAEPNPAPGCGDLNRVACYAPLVRFDQDEVYFPMEPEDFIFNSELRWAHGGLCGDGTLEERSWYHLGWGTEIQATFQPSAEYPMSAALGNGQYQAYEGRGIHRGCSEDESRAFTTNELTRPYSGGTTAPNGAQRAKRADEESFLDSAEGFFLEWTGEDADRRGTVVDGQVQSQVFYSERPRSVTYWFFYGHDPKSDDWVGDSTLLGHQGDWEHITVHFEDGAPSEVDYAGHGCKITLGWDESQRNGTHPVVYVAQGTHASYPGFVDNSLTNNTLTDAGCQPGAGATDYNQFVPGVSASWPTWQSAVPIDQQCWYGYGGAWGATANRFAHLADALIGLAIDTLDAKTGPLGAPYNIASGSQEGLGPCPDAPSYTEAPGPGLIAGWGDTITGAVEDIGRTINDELDPTDDLIAIFNSVPTVADTANIGPDGTATITATVPPGTSPGLHRLVILNAATGETVASRQIVVEVPEGCGTDPTQPADPSVDVDQDWLVDDCDPSPLDGPAADYDGDGVLNAIDNCPTILNPGQERVGTRSTGIPCDPKIPEEDSTYDVNDVAVAPALSTEQDWDDFRDGLDLPRIPLNPDFPRSGLDAGTDPDEDVAGAGLTADERYVNGLYDLFLGRDATRAELDAGVPTVATGGRGALTLELSTSTEWAGVVIDGIYDNALDRTPDAGGRRFWVNQLDDGSSTASVSVSIYASPEAVERAGSTEAWVTDLYRRILDRNPDAEGLEFWVESIDSERLHPAHVVEAFWDSPEFRMMRVRDTYQSVLGRDPDQEGWVYWAGRLSEMDEVRLAAHLAASDEFHSRVTG